MGFLSGLFTSMSRDYSDGATCPLCNNKCYWDDEACDWRCKSCGYDVSGSDVEYDRATDKVHVLGIDWYCDRCNAYLNIQSRFNPYGDSWKCTTCGYCNGLTEDDLI